ncbi:MAG: GNAT family N-acetyltransferase [Acidobacteriota bacterium]
MTRVTRAAITLRRARSDDAERLLQWRNDPQTRRWYLQRARVPRRDHEGWLSLKLADRACRIYIVEERGTPVGQLRVERIAPGAAEVSLSVDAAARGRAIGSAMLERAAAAARRELRARKLLAHVRPENVPSAVAFLKAGFRFTRLERHGGATTYVFVRMLA